MPNPVKEQVFREAQRVLKPGGELWLWDVPMSSARKVFALRLQVTLPGGRRLQTTYGVRAKDQSAASLCRLLQEARFEASVISQHKNWFLIQAKR